MDTAYLRTATRAEHEGTEATVPLMAADLTRAEYAATLRRLYGAVRAWDDWSVAHAPEHLRMLLAGRQRSALIEADLHALGHALGDALPSPPAPLVQAPWMSAPPSPGTANGQRTGEQNTSAGEVEARFLGAMYVIEGSTLGGQYIARHAEDVLHLQQGEGNAYFRGYGDQTGAMWRQFKAVLAAVPDRYTDDVIAAAKAMFAFFAEHMQPRVETAETAAAE